MCDKNLILFERNVIAEQTAILLILIGNWTVNFAVTSLGFTNAFSVNWTVISIEMTRV